MQSSQKELLQSQKAISKTVEIINSQINPVFDIDALSTEDLREYKLKELATACTTCIYAGTDVETSLGIEHFGYTENDQQNIKTAFESAKLGLPAPYHADGKDCRIFSPVELLTIYGVCESFKTYHTTYCNLMNNIIRTEINTETLKNMKYGDALPPEKGIILEQSMQQVKTIFEAIESELMKYLILPTETNPDKFLNRSETEGAAFVEESKTVS